MCISVFLLYLYISAYIFLGAAARSNVLSFNYLANNGPSGFPVGNLSDPYLAGRRHPTCSELIYNMCGGREILYHITPTFAELNFVTYLLPIMCDFAQTSVLISIKLDTILITALLRISSLICCLILNPD